MLSNDMTALTLALRRQTAFTTKLEGSPDRARHQATAQRRVAPMGTKQLRGLIVDWERESTSVRAHLQQCGCGVETNERRSE
jgi:hypothetical protein